MAEVVQAADSSLTRSRRDYDAFLSCSDGDQGVGDAIEKGLHQIGRRVGLLRALRVFRDDGDPTVSPESWAKITAALDGSRFLIVVLSPRAAVSQRIDDEVRRWFTRGGLDGLMLVLAGGRLVWDGGRGGFDPAGSSSALPVLTEPGSLPVEPLFLDVSGDAPWDVSSLVFRDKLTSLAAPIHGKPKDELTGDDLREQRRFRRLRRAAVAGLALLTVFAVVAGSVAFVQRGRAIRQARDSLAAELDTKAAEVFARAVPDSDIHALADTLAAQRIRSNPAASAGAFYTAATALNTTRTILAEPAAIRGLAISRDGHLLAAAEHDAIRLWSLTDLAHPAPLGQLLRDNAASVAFSPDGRTLASGSFDKTVRLWSVADPARPTPLGQPLRGHTSTVLSVAFSPDGRSLASGGSDKSVRLWGVADPARPAPLGQPLLGHIDQVEGVAFSPDGRTLASGSSDRTVRLWDVADPTRPAPLGQPLSTFSSVNCVAFSPDGHTLASAGQSGEIKLWTLTGPDPASWPHASWHNLEADDPAIFNSVAFSPDGRTLATGGSDTAVRLWDLTDPGEITPLGGPLRGHTDSVQSVVFDSDGRTVVSASLDSTVRLWDVATASTLSGPEYKVVGVAFRPDGHFLVGSDAIKVWLWDLSHRGGAEPSGPQLRGRSILESIASMAFSPNGRILAAGDSYYAVRLWNLADPVHPAPLSRSLRGHSDTVNSVAFSPDGRTLASGSRDATVRLWNLTDPAHPAALGQPLTGHTGPVNSVAFSPDGHTVASGSSDGTVRLWNVADLAHPGPLGGPLRGHSDTVNSVAFSPDGHTVASGSLDQTVRLWNVADLDHPGPLGAPLRGHADSVTGVAFSPDGGNLASGSADGVVQMWDLTDVARPGLLGQPLHAHTKDLTGVAFSPDGRTLASGSADNTVSLLPTPSDAPVDSHTVATLCSRLVSNISHQQWRDWISPTLEYLTLCPDLPVPND